MAINKLNPIEGGVPKGDTANRSVEFPSPEIGDVYYNGELEILEIYNGTTWVAVSAPPSTPTIASVTDFSTTDAYTSSAGKLQVVFTAGSGGGTPNQYNIYTTAGGFSASSSSSPLTLSGLTPGTAYTIYGTAQNNFGTTVNTGNFASVTPTTLPQVPTIGTATASTSANEVTVTWTNGNNGGKNLSAITITPFLNGTTAETSRTAATTSSTSYTFTQGQLTGGASYTFKVKATNANGTCADSTATNSVTMPAFFNVDYLVVAGGGGGGGGTGDQGGGGGGAGGLRSTVTATGGGGSLESVLSINKNNNYTVTVGAGGAGGPQVDWGVSGNNSVFSTITSIGGGGGARQDRAGLDGGSGGGAGSGGQPTSGGARTVNQGFAGGSNTGPNYHAGGGGGAGAAGTNGGNSNGAGGAGVAVSITGSSVTYAGGGGGGTHDANRTQGPGGSGGGGASGTYQGNVGNPGTANLGGGGGGGSGIAIGGAGGSGVVVLRYLTSDATITIGAGLTGSTATSGSYKVTTITAGTGNVSWT
jgi:mucin-19